MSDSFPRTSERCWQRLHDYEGQVEESYADALSSSPALFTSSSRLLISSLPNPVTTQPPFRVDSNLNSIKGGGACQLREKVLAEAADTWVMVADYRKNSEVLGTNVSAAFFDS